MILFPSMCVDNFYSNPDLIREYALKQQFSNKDGGIYPGIRTKPIEEFDEQFFNLFCNKLFSIYYDFNVSNVSWKVSSSFQMINPYESKEISYKNIGWIHEDINCLFAGVIYLTPNINKNCGTSVFELKPNSIYDKLQDKRKEYYSDGTDDEYDISIQNNNGCFDETTRFNNLYNRLVSFDGKSYHGANNFYTESESRLTQVFFVYEINTKSLCPIDRMKKWDSDIENYIKENK